MKVRKLHKQRLKNIPRASYHEGKRPRKNATYFSDYCCKQCYFDWGRGFDRKILYRHSCAKSNYDGILKKYWKSSEDFQEDME